MRLGEPRQIGEELSAELAFYIAFQEFGFEIAEESFPMDGVVGGDDAAAGNGVDDIDLVEQPPAPAAHPELHVAQRFHRSVGERRRARASARQRQDDQHIARIVGIGLDALKPVALGEILACDRRVDRRMSVATDKRERAEQYERRQPSDAEYPAKF